MTLLRFSHWGQTRRLLRTLERIAVAQEHQTDCLRRLTDHLCGPELPEPAPEDLRRLTGAAYTRDGELARIEAYRDRMAASTGRVPSDDEVAQWLDGVEV